MKLFVATAMLVAGTSAFAAPQVKVVTSGNTDEGVFGPWSSVCVDNVDLKQDVAAQYRYGGDGAWTDIKIEQNTLVMFEQKFDNDADPMKFEVQFLNAVGGTTLSYGLDETVTRFRARGCDQLVNYGFKGTDGGTIDLVKVQ